MMDFSEMFGGEKNPISQMILSGFGTAPPTEQMTGQKPRRRRRRKQVVDQYANIQEAATPSAQKKEPPNERSLAGMNVGRTPEEVKASSAGLDKEAIYRLGAVMREDRKKQAQKTGYQNDTQSYRQGY